MEWNTYRVSGIGPRGVMFSEHHEASTHELAIRRANAGGLFESVDRVELVETPGFDDRGLVRRLVAYVDEVRENRSAALVCRLGHHRCSIAEAGDCSHGAWILACQVAFDFDEEELLELGLGG